MLYMMVRVFTLVMVLVEHRIMEAILIPHMEKFPSTITQLGTEMSQLEKTLYILTQPEILM